MKAHHIVSVFLLTALSPVRGAAQTGWTLDECIARARESSPNLAAARNLARSSELSQRELRATALPQTRISAKALYTPKAGTLGYDPALTDGGEYAGQFVVQQVVYDGGIRGLKSEQIQIEIEQRNGDIRRSERDLLFAVRGGCVDVLRAREESSLQRESVRQLEEYLDLVNRLARGGTASVTDVLKTDLQLANARLSLRRAEESEESSTIALKEIIGLPPDTVFGVRGSLDEIAARTPEVQGPPAGGVPPSNLDIAQAERELSRSLLDIELVRRETNPTLSLVADAGVLASGDNLRLPVEQREPIVGYSVGMTLEIPLLTWGASGFRVEQKEIAAENIRLEQLALRRSFEATFRRLRLQRDNARVRLGIARETVSRAEENFLLTKSKFVAGAGLSFEVLAAQQLLTESRMSELQALADVNTILARIDQILAQ